MDLQYILDFVLGRRLVEIELSKVLNIYIVTATIHEKPCLFRETTSYDISFCATNEDLAQYKVMQYINDHVVDRIPFKSDERNYDSVRIVETRDF